MHVALFGTTMNELNFLRGLVTKFPAPCRSADVRDHDRRLVVPAVLGDVAQRGNPAAERRLGPRDSARNRRQRRRHRTPLHWNQVRVRTRSLEDKMSQYSLTTNNALFL